MWFVRPQSVGVIEAHNTRGRAAKNGREVMDIDCLLRQACKEAPYTVCSLYGAPKVQLRRSVVFSVYR